MGGPPGDGSRQKIALTARIPIDNAEELYYRRVMSRRLGKRKKGESPVLILRVPAETRAALERESRRRGRTVSEHVREVLERSLRRSGR